MIDKKRVGLALSGGGYRAAAFHLGTFRKLHELKVLDKVDIISCISGGSIIGTYYCLNKELPFEEIDKSFQACLRKSVIRRLLIYMFVWSLPFIVILVLLVFKKLVLYAFLLLILGVLLFLFFQFTILPVSMFVDWIYAQIFFGKKEIKDLKQEPTLLINATNLETGRLWSFSQNKMGDSSYEFRKAGKINFEQARFRLSKAVASSTCVPFAFSPIKITKRFFSNKNDFSKISPRLIDGGVYDNQGLHKITQPNSSYKCDVIIVSDAGMKFSSNVFSRNNFSLLQRTSDILMQRIKNLQFQHNVYYKSLKPAKEIAYSSLTWEIENCLNGFIDNLLKGNIDRELIFYHNISVMDIEESNVENLKKTLKKSIEYSEIEKQNLGFEEKFIARNVSTNLTSLSKSKIKYLSNHAAVMTEIQIKLYCPSLFKNINEM